MIYNTITGNFYIGSSLNLAVRLAQHLYAGQHGNQLPLYRAFRKYGLENYYITILNFCEPKPSTCIALEQSALDTHKPPYNILKQAGLSAGSDIAPRLFNIFSSCIQGKTIRDMGLLLPRVREERLVWL
jgi:group I intron endonuclease